MWPLLIVAVATCIALALRRTRWAAVSLRVSRWTYGLVMPLSLLYFPIKSGFRLRPVACEWTFDFALAIHSLTNAPHLVMMAIFFVLTWAQLPNTKRAMAWSFAASFTIGFLVEIAEGATGIHHCRMRDLIPDMAGASLGALLVILSRQITDRRR
jgi:VanZ family protein